jgi:hypothetical protein
MSDSKRAVSDALDIRFDSDAGDDLTIRGYLRELLTTLWSEGEGFSGKRPFGNSGWSGDLFKPLVQHGFINGVIDSDGYLEDYDSEAGVQFVFALINEALKDPAAPIAATGQPRATSTGTSSTTRSAAGKPPLR